MTEEFTIRDVVELISNVQHIKDAVDRIETQVSTINGTLREAEKDIAVLQKGAEDHKETHETHEKEHDKIDARIRNVAVGNVGWTSFVGLIATLIGR